MKAAFFAGFYVRKLFEKDCNDYDYNDYDYDYIDNFNHDHNFTRHQEGLISLRSNIID